MIRVMNRRPSPIETIDGHEFLFQIKQNKIITEGVLTFADATHDSEILIEKDFPEASDCSNRGLATANEGQRLRTQSSKAAPNTDDEGVAGTMAENSSRLRSDAVVSQPEGTAPQISRVEIEEYLAQQKEFYPHARGTWILDAAIKWGLRPKHASPTPVVSGQAEPREKLRLVAADGSVYLAYPEHVMKLVSSPPSLPKAGETEQVNNGQK